MNANHGLVALDRVCPDVMVDLRYATDRNFFKTRLYDDDRAWLLEPTARKLSRAALLASARGLVLVVLDAYRPLAVQDLMWRILPDPDFVAPSSKGSIHNRGAAVDVTLAYDDGRLVGMPSDFDEFSERASHRYKGVEYGNLEDVDLSDSGLASEVGTLERQAMEARDFLRSCMESAGFVAYEAEWWHYTDPDTRESPLLNLSLSQLAAADGVSHV